ncbi:MAG: hypothetical protein LBR07_05160 [Puniceicoccales bacterium]|jgi:hypothetical protein|nr:hypothetical protein [Puniceicoccales bacterium]
MINHEEIIPRRRCIGVAWEPQVLEAGRRKAASERRSFSNYVNRLVDLDTTTTKSVEGGKKDEN